MQMSKDVLDLIKFIIDKLVSWPVVTLILFLVFKKSVGTFLTGVQALLGRDKVKFDLGSKGLSIDVSHAAQAQIESKPPTEALLIAQSELDDETKTKLENAKNVGMIPIVQRQIKSIEDDINKMKLSDKDAKELLTKHLAAMQLVFLAERAYRLIFGSQIALLKGLNTAGSAPEDKLRQYYEGVKTIHPQFYATYPFESYMGFLVSQGLINKNQDGQYFVTDVGKEFLKWLTDAAVSENKPF